MQTKSLHSLVLFLVIERVELQLGHCTILILWLVFSHLVWAIVGEVHALITILASSFLSLEKTSIFLGGEFSLLLGIQI
jgi:hypothetical protein